MDWIGRQRTILRNVANALGVAACLWLMIWLWGRPSAGVAGVPPAIVRITPTVPATPKEGPANAAAPNVVAPNVVAPNVVAPNAVAAESEKAESAPAVTDTGSADTTGGGVQKPTSRVNVAGGRDYTAPPWTKWYDDPKQTGSQQAGSERTGSGQASAGPATATDRGKAEASPGADSAVTAEPAPAAKGGGR